MGSLLTRDVLSNPELDWQVYAVGGLSGTPFEGRLPLEALEALIGGGAVDSVFGRTGAVVAQAGDYSAGLITFSPSGNLEALNVQAALEELDTEKASAAALTALEQSLADVATSGDYGDLLNTPILAAVALSGDYGDLLNTPTLGTIASQNANNVSISGGSITGITDLAIADGGTGQSTQQAAINALTAVSGATIGHVLTKSAGGDAVWEAAAGGLSLTVDIQADVLTTSPASPTIAFATDTGNFLVWDGSGWWMVTMTSLSFGQLDFSEADNSAWIGVI
jgi:hypothetical protein